MSDEKKSPIEYLILFAVITVIGLLAGIYLANYVFMTWQEIPMSLFSYKTIFNYQAMFGEHPVVAKAIKISMATIAVPPIVLNIVTALALFSKPKREQHGSARFANMADVRKSGLLLTPKQQKEKKAKIPSNPSVLVGKYKGKLLEFWGNEFTFVAAPTRSGKGVGVVIPNLLHYPDSCVVLDIKNENWDITAGFRSKYQDCYLFAPKAEDGCSHRYNPLDYINKDETKRMGDIQNIANILYPADGDDVFWNNNAQRLFNGLVLYMLETPARPCTMAELIKLTTPSVPLNEWIEKTINSRQDEAIIINTETEEKAVRPLSVECIEALMAFAGNASENTRAGILSSLMSPLGIFTDPMVAAATSASDFDLRDVRRKRMSIYVGIQPNELPRFDKLLNLFFSQLINLNTRVLPEQDPSLKYQCLVLLDEFTALGRVDIINKAVAYIAGYNMRLMLIFQNRGQAEQYYGREGTQTMLSNMACQIIFAPREIDDAENYSKILGTETIKGRSVSKNRGKGGGGSVSTSDQSRALMLPQEMLELDQSQEIIKYQAHKPIMCEKIRYYEEQTFTERANLPIKDKCKPKELNVREMLAVMRGTKQKKIANIDDLPSGEELIKNHRGYIEQLSVSLGFDADFLDLDNYEAA